MKDRRACVGCVIAMVGGLFLWAVVIAGGKVLLDNWLRINLATNWGASKTAIILLILCGLVYFAVRKLRTA